MSPPHRRGPVAVLALLLAAALASCGYGSRAVGVPDAAPAAADGARKLSASEVRVGYFPNLTHATALVGLQEGLIEKELNGTKIKPQTFNAGPSEIEALNGGSLDIGFIGPSPSINGYVKSKGSNLRIISGSAASGAELVVNPDKIKTLNDLKGKKIATPQKGNTQDVSFLNWVSAKGWKVNSESGRGDVSVLRTDSRLVPHAFQSGAIDGAWVLEPTASQLVADGGSVLLDETSLWHGTRPVVTNVVASQKFLKEHPDVVEAVLRGTVNTNAWIASNPGRAKDAANSALKALSGRELDPKVIDPAWPGISVTDDPLAATLKTQSDWAV
ncbi:ABC transporter substrate-binding protein, partial [Streptomyces sp. NPDC004126]|uniref:ABC transporter substrate-binding protein n=1 Tax=Streptomyces sp. NPDC004126 TaxID=3390695 RepID=UPI003D0259C0